jgi:hypothetical protein
MYGFCKAMEKKRWIILGIWLGYNHTFIRYINNSLSLGINSLINLKIQVFHYFSFLILLSISTSLIDF